MYVIQPTLCKRAQNSPFPHPLEYAFFFLKPYKGCPAQISQVVFAVVFEADSFLFFPSSCSVITTPGKTRRTFSVTTSDADRREQTGQAAAPRRAPPRGARQHPSVPERGPGEDWDSNTRKKRPLLNLSELPRRRIDYSTIIFRHLSLLDTPRRDAGVLNFPTWCIAERGTWNVFFNYLALTRIWVTNT